MTTVRDVVHDGKSVRNHWPGCQERPEKLSGQSLPQAEDCTQTRERCNERKARRLLCD
ncbi:MULTISPECIES: hypothetical protein [unclassified Methanoregula]|uniref:hypothetical protein n=1 Tax=unclassified Methanoregula TaxID=2649730 RepID=UPI002600962E|nr:MULTISPECIES: hypothetical protein [unclassified Methanoregula]